MVLTTVLWSRHYGPRSSVLLPQFIDTTISPFIKLNVQAIGRDANMRLFATEVKLFATKGNRNYLSRCASKAQGKAVRTDHGSVIYSLWDLGHEVIQPLWTHGSQYIKRGWWSPLTTPTWATRDACHCILRFSGGKSRKCPATLVWLAKAERKFTRRIFRSLQNLWEGCKIRREQKSGTRQDLTQHTSEGPSLDHLWVTPTVQSPGRESLIGWP